MTTLAPPEAPIRASITDVSNVLDDITLDGEEIGKLAEIGFQFSEPPDQVNGPSFLLVAVLAWLKARRTTHPGLSWEDAERLIVIALT